jgi:hypothetical protein
MVRKLKDYINKKDWDRYINNAKESSMFGIGISNMEKEDLLCVIGWLSENPLDPRELK